MAIRWKYGVESQEGRCEQDCADLVISFLNRFGWIYGFLTIIFFNAQKQLSLLKGFSKNLSTDVPMLRGKAKNAEIEQMIVF